MTDSYLPGMYDLWNGMMVTHRRNRSIGAGTLLTGYWGEEGETCCARHIRDRL